jgi:hypothetical protein
MRRVIPVLLATVALLAAACGGDSGADSTTSTSISTPTTSTTAVESTTTTSTLPTSTTTAEATTTTTTGAPGTTTPTGLPGEPIDFGPAEGDVLMVIGVRHDDVLNLRAGPGTNQAIREGIPPAFTELVARGNTRQLPSSLWIEVSYESTTGWVSLRFVGYEGDTTDETARVVSDLGETPVESTMTALGDLVAEQFASQDEPESDIVQMTPVTTGDLAEVTFDVVGLGDDAIRGVRLHIFAEPGSGGFSLKSVEATVICGRGVDADRACV